MFNIKAILENEQKPTFNSGVYNIVKWAGVVVIISGSVILSTTISLGMNAIAMGLFFMGHILWAVAGYGTKDKPLLAINVLLMPLDINGIILRTTELINT